MNYTQLLEILKTNVRVETNRYAQEILVKDVPDEGDFAGDFDPRVLGNAKRIPEDGSPFGARKKPPIEVLRGLMGWDNQDITGGKISRTEKMVPTPHGEVFTLVYGMEAEKTKPCIVFFHGGGFFGGSLKCVENPCKAIAMYADAVVVSVDYALAPEHPFPEGFHNCFDVVKYIFAHPQEFGVDQEKIGVCGDSAGANLAAVCALQDRNEKNGIIKYQALLYPPVNIAALPNAEYVWAEDEYDVRRNAAYLNRAIYAIGSDAQMLIQTYLHGDAALAKEALVSPLFAELTGVAPAFIVNAEYDYLRIEGEAYGRALHRAGVPVVNMRYRGVDHAFMDKIGEYPQAEDCMREVAERFLKTLASQA